MSLFFSKGVDWSVCILTMALSQVVILETSVTHAASQDHFCTVWCVKCYTLWEYNISFCLCNAFNLIYFLITIEGFCFLCLLKCWMLRHVCTSVWTSFHHIMTVPLEMLGAPEQKAKLHALHVRTACLMQEMSRTAGCIHAAVETWYILNVTLPGRGENWHVAAHLIWQHTVSAPALSVDLPRRCRWWRGESLSGILPQTAAWLM